MSPLLKEALDDLRAEVRMLRADNDRLSRMVTGLSALAEARRVALEESMQHIDRSGECRCGCGAYCPDLRARIMKLAEGGGS